MLARDSSPMMSSKMAALLHSPTPTNLSSPLSNKTGGANQFQSKNIKLTRIINTEFR